MDEKRREYDIVVIGEESHLAYNRVGLTSFFQHRKAENLYLNPHEWVSEAWPPRVASQDGIRRLIFWSFLVLRES